MNVILIYLCLLSTVLSIPWHRNSQPMRTSPTRWDRTTAAPPSGFDDETTPPGNTNTDAGERHVPTTPITMAMVSSECSEESPLQKDYRGVKDSTENGNVCQRWDSQSPHSHSNSPESKPDSGLEDNNYCRNPDNSARGAWCYTTSSSVRWEYCGIPECEEVAECSEESPLQKDYRGVKATTENGNECQRWDSQSPHSHGNSPESKPDSGLEDNNYCRNPDNSARGAWCYTTSSSVRWEYCGIPDCDVECAAGEYEDSDGSCKNCSVNTYSNAGENVCTPCPDNTLSGAGSSSIVACQFDCSSCKAELNEVCQDDQCKCSDCNVRGADNVCVKKYEIHYQLVKLYDDAKSLCEADGLNLATINSEADSSAFNAAAKLVYGDSRETRTFDSANWIWIGATDLANKGEYRFQNGDVLSFKAPWAPRQPDHKAQGEILQRYVAVSRWGEWDDSFGHYWERTFACSC